MHQPVWATRPTSGAGAGIVQQMNFRGLAARVCGVDVDPRTVNNAI
jgi:hypothetical protein